MLKDEERVRRMEDKKRDFEEKAAEDEQRREERKRRKEEKRAEKRGRKRAAEDDDIEEERLRQQAEGEQKEEDRPAPQGEKRKAQDDGGRPGPSDGGGMDLEVVVQGGAAVWDDVRGGWLDKEAVRKARMEEVGFMEKEKLWDVVSREMAAGKRIVSVKWVDTNKGTEEAPEIRCRLVARDFNSGDRDREDLFAATPPWELKRLLMSHAADRADGAVRKMLLIDVKRPI